MTNIKTSAAYRSKECGYKYIFINGDKYEKVNECRAILNTLCTKTSYSESPIGGFTYEGEYEYINYSCSDEAALFRELEEYSIKG